MDAARASMVSNFLRSPADEAAALEWERALALSAGVSANSTVSSSAPPIPTPVLARRAMDEVLFFDALDKEDSILCLFRSAPGVLRKDAEFSGRTTGVVSDSSVRSSGMISAALLSGPGVLANRPREGGGLFLLSRAPFRSRTSKYLEPGPPRPPLPLPLPLPIRPICTPLM